MKTKFDFSFDPPVPIGTVVLRDTETGKRSIEIRMLLDTGSDLSLVPESAVRAFDIKPTETKLELTGFDGSTKSYEMIGTQLVFLGKRFSGNYCVIKDEIGILGRDVLNQLAIVFDGPDLAGDEIKSSEEHGVIS